MRADVGALILFYNSKHREITKIICKSHFNVYICGKK